jgi:hypothetical protein
MAHSKGTLVVEESYSLIHPRPANILQDVDLFDEIAFGNIELPSLDDYFPTPSNDTVLSTASQMFAATVLFDNSRLEHFSLTDDCLVTNLDPSGVSNALGISGSLLDTTEVEVREPSFPISNGQLGDIRQNMALETHEGPMSRAVLLRTESAANVDSLASNMKKTRKRIDLIKRKQGNNRFGSKGNFRCQVCRSRNSRVLYVSLSEPDILVRLHV